MTKNRPGFGRLFTQAILCAVLISTSACGYYLYDDVAYVSADADTDGDGLSDDDEYLIGTDVYSADSDSDGVTDGEEYFEFWTDPLFPDSDSDGLEDGEELFVYATDPLDWDTDRDGFGDGREVRRGTDPLFFD